MLARSEPRHRYRESDTPRALKPWPETLWRVPQRKLDQLNAAVSVASLAIPPGNRLEALVRELRATQQHNQRAVQDLFQMG